MSIKLLCILTVYIANILSLQSDTKISPQQKKQFIYVLRYTPQFKESLKWTSKEYELAQEHVLYVKGLFDEGRCYMLGRTTNLFDANLFGIVVVDATNIEEAKSIMQNDPMVKNGIMTGEVNLFSIVFAKGK